MSLRKIRLRNPGPNGNYRTGQEIEVDEARAKWLVRRKYAYFIDRAKKGR